MVYAVAILFAGFVATSLGPRKTMAIFFTIAGLGVLVFARVPDFTALRIGAGMIGLGAAVVVTSATVIFSRWFSMKEYSKVTAMFFVAGGIGTMGGTAPLIALTKTYDWQFAFTCVGVFVLVISSLSIIFTRDFPPAELAPKDDEDAPKTTTPQAAFAAAEQSTIRLLGRALLNKNFWCIVVWYVSISADYYSFAGAWAGKYLTEIYKQPSFGHILTFFAVGFTVGGPLLTYVSERIFRSYRVGMFVSNALAAAGYALLVFATDSLPYAGLYALILLIGLTSAPSAIVYTTTRSVFGPRLAGVLSGVWSFVLFGSGAVINMLVGGVLDSSRAAELDIAHQYQSDFWIFFICAIAGIIAGLVMTDVYRQRLTAGNTETDPVKGETHHKAETSAA